MIKSYDVYLNTDRVPYLRETGASYNSLSLRDPDAVIDFARDALRMHERAEEVVIMLALDTKLNLIGLSEVSHGTASLSFASPREICQRALLLGACAVVLLHNHPSGCVTPSAQDNDVTAKVKEACRIIDVPLTDHVIIGSKSYYSYTEQGTL